MANWGSYTLLLGFPRATVPVDTLKQYAVEAMSGYVGRLTIHERGDRIIVDFSYAEEDGGGGRLDEDDAASWLPSLAQLRSDTQNGDLRALYLGWLSGATVNLLEYASADEEDLDEEVAERLDALEPPIPPGLRDLSAPLETLTRFLEIDEGLLAAAAKASPLLTSTKLADTDITAGIAQWPPEEKDALLARVAAGDATVGIEIRGRLHAERAATSAPTLSVAPRRTVRELLAGKEHATASRLANEAAAKPARQEYLDALAGREEQTWAHIQALVQQKQARPYDEAVRLLADLAELAD